MAGSCGCGCDKDGSDDSVDIKFGNDCVDVVGDGDCDGS